MSFRTFFLDLDADEREAYAKRATSTVGYLMQVAYGNKKVELGMADVLVAVSDGRVVLDDLPLTERAASQHRIRSGDVAPEPTAAQGA